MPALYILGIGIVIVAAVVAFFGHVKVAIWTAIVGLALILGTFLVPKVITALAARPAPIAAPAAAPAVKAVVPATIMVNGEPVCVGTWTSTNTKCVDKAAPVYVTGQAPAVVPAPAAPAANGTVVFNPCVDGANPDAQIEPLKENGEVVPNAFMALDLNSREVTSGQRYHILIPVGAYAHLFVAVNDGDPKGNAYTYEVHGGNGVKTVSTALTVWCRAGNWDKNLAGKTRVMNAKNLPAALKNIWMAVPASGIMPIPTGESTSAPAAPAAKPAAAANASAAPAAAASKKGDCAALGAGWKASGNNMCQIGPLAANAALTNFVVPSWAAAMDWSEGNNPGKRAQPGDTVAKLHTATLFFAP